MTDRERRHGQQAGISVAISQVMMNTSLRRLLMRTRGLYMRRYHGVEPPTDTRGAEDHAWR